MTSKNAKENSLKAFGATIFCIVLIIAFIAIIAGGSTDTKIRQCEKTGQAYDTSSKKCRDKTVSEKFKEKCTSGVTIDGVAYSCAKLKELGLQNAFLNNSIVKHGSSLYEAGTAAEINAGKNAGAYCLSASDTWSHIGEKRCVVFNYEWMACSNGYCFLDEKKDYKNGFVAFFGKYNMHNWDSFVATYKGKGPILVCGQIYAYQGHPEIKITNVGSQTALSPKVSYSGGSVVYKYSCN